MDQKDRHQLSALLWQRAVPAPSVEVPAALEAVPMTAHRTVTLDELHVIGPDRRPRRHRTHQRLRATTERLTTYHYVFDTPFVDVTVEDGGYAGRLVPYGPDLWGVPIQLARMLEPGEDIVLVYDSAFRYPGEVAPNFSRINRTELDGLTLRVRFDQGDLPRTVRRWSRSGPGGDLDTVEVRVDGQGVALATIGLTAAGSELGLRWVWG